MGRKTVYNNIVTTELWDSVNIRNKRLLDDFLDYKRSSDKSPNTIDQYYSVLKIFFVWNLTNNENKFFVDVKKRDFIKFFNYVVTELKSSPNRTITVRAILSSLSNYVENILDDEYENYRNVVKNIETVAKEPIREKTILTLDEVDECLQKLVADKKYQIACYMALAVGCGARKAELLRFKWQYFTDDNIVFGCLYKTPEKIATKGNGSRGKMLYKYTFVAQFKPYYDLWMKERERLGIDNEYLFVSRQPNGYEQAHVSTANHWADTISLYLNKDFYFHSLRHLWTTNLKRKNLPDAVIQQLQGWKTADMVNIYSDLDIEDVLGDYFDEDGIREDIKVAKITDI